MTYLDYMQDHPDENLGWCIPYANDSGDHVLVMCEGKPMSLKSPLCTAHSYDGTLTEKAMRCFASEVNRNYDLYSGWDDTHIALESMHPVGCASCPWRKECDAMSCAYSRA